MATRAFTGVQGTVRNDGGPVFFDPGLAVEHVAPTPLLMIVATDDRLAATDVALAAFLHFDQVHAERRLDDERGPHRRMGT